MAEIIGSSCVDALHGILCIVAQEEHLLCCTDILQTIVARDARAVACVVKVIWHESHPQHASNIFVQNARYLMSQKHLL